MSETLGCGHVPDKGMPATVDGKTVQGWRFVLRNGKKICHACADAIVLDCGHAPSPHEPFTTGYGRTADGKTHCYACCHAHDVAQLRDTSKPFVAYISGDGKSVTNWPGAPLMRIYSHHEGRAGFGGRMHYWRAVDVHGRHWHGKNSGRGMCVTLRACK